MYMKDRIALLKEELKMTTEDLSIKSGVPIGTINKILNGETPNPRLSTSKAIAKALSCTLDFLTGEVNYSSAGNEVIYHFGEQYSGAEYQLNLSSIECELIFLWRKASPEGQNAARAVLTAYKKLSEDCAM